MCASRYLCIKFLVAILGEINTSDYLSEWFDLKLNISNSDFIIYL